MDDDRTRADLATIYPQFGLRIAHAGLVLLPPTDPDLLELADVVAEPGAVLGPDQEGFLRWDPGTGDDAVDAFLHHFWDLRRRPGPDAWRAAFVVLAEGRAVGMTEMGASRWSADRTVGTGSWLARAEQGRGVGTRVRLMLLELAFAHLGADRATSVAHEGNAASRRVSTRCGYRETGRGTDPRGAPEVHLAVTPRAWRRRRLADVVVDGVDELRAALDPGAR